MLGLSVGPFCTEVSLCGSSNKCTMVSRTVSVRSKLLRERAQWLRSQVGVLEEEVETLVEDVEELVRRPDSHQPPVVFSLSSSCCCCCFFYACNVSCICDREVGSLPPVRSFTAGS